MIQNIEQKKVEQKDYRRQQTLVAIFIPSVQGPVKTKGHWMIQLALWYVWRGWGEGGSFVLWINRPIIVLCLTKMPVLYYPQTHKARWPAFHVRIVVLIMRFIIFQHISPFGTHVKLICGGGGRMADRGFHPMLSLALINCELRARVAALPPHFLPSCP